MTCREIFWFLVDFDPILSCLRPWQVQRPGAQSAIDLATPGAALAHEQELKCKMSPRIAVETCRESAEPIDPLPFRFD